MPSTTRRAELELALHKLEHLQDFGPHDEESGICDNAGIRTALVAELAQDWPHYSGHPLYPVSAGIGQPPGEARKEQARATYLFSGMGVRWDESTTYGSLRWQLLAHLVEKIRQELENERPEN